MKMENNHDTLLRKWVSGKCGGYKNSNSCLSCVHKNFGKHCNHPSEMR